MRREEGKLDTSGRWRWLALAALLAAGQEAAAQAETQHGFDAGFRLTARLDLVLHGRIRTQPGRLGLYQARGGPILEYSWNSRFRLIAGYYYAEQENSQKDFIGGHRWFGGAEGRVWSARPSRVDVRLLAERFELAQGRDYTRYRVRARVSGTRTAAPYGSVESFFDAQGWRSTRCAAGLRWRNGRSISFDVGYFVEPRRADIGRTRHMFLTGVHWNFGTERRPDPDR